jgi:transitional endoplasmic reticulum ATPase
MPSVKFEVDQKPKLEEGQRVQVTSEDFMTAYKEVEPTSTREFMSERPNIFFKDIGGLHQIKKNLLSMMRLPLRGQALFAHSRLTPPRGVIFSGPSGTGKTLMAKAIAGEMGMTLFTASRPPVVEVGRRVGKRAREVFKRAKQARPAFSSSTDRGHGPRPLGGGHRCGFRSGSSASSSGRSRPAEIPGRLDHRRHQPDRHDGAALLRSGRFDSSSSSVPSKEVRLESCRCSCRPSRFRTESTQR